LFNLEIRGDNLNGKEHGEMIQKNGHQNVKRKLVLPLVMTDHSGCHLMITKLIFLDSLYANIKMMPNSIRSNLKMNSQVITL